MKKLLTILFLLISIGLFAQPGNDDCSGATPVTPNGSCQTGTNVSANDNWAGEIGCATLNGPNAHLDVWYSFVATGTSVDIDVTDLTVSSTLEVILVEPAGLPCTGPFTVLGTQCGTVTVTLTYSSLVIGNTYYYTISAPNSATGTFEHCATASSPPPISGNQDCSNATLICSNSSFTGNSNGLGVQELTAGNSGCLGIEHQSSWYTFTIQTSGTLQMLINPSGADDYDFAIWGPNSNCPPTSTPIRCSYAAGTGNTGMNATALDLTEGVFGNGFVAQLNVIAGQTYILLIDNFSSSTNPFNLNWGGTATLDCTPLPIELIDWSGYNKNGVNNLTWATASEINNDYFLIERSIDGINWDRIGTMEGAGNSNTGIVYDFDDTEFQDSLNYYRLSQVDFDGQKEQFHIISIDNRKEPKILIKRYNLMGQELTDETYMYYNGIVIERYNDGTTLKFLKHSDF